MNRSVVVFDFDKTLTDRDTLFGFYRSVAGSEWLFLPKRILLLVAGVLYKTGLIKNRTLKRFGTYLFLKGRTRDELETVARRYSEQIELNNIYFNHFQKTEVEKWVISASPEIYLRHLFPAEHVAGTTYKYSGNKVKDLDINMFGREKKRYLSDKGISSIHELYTDSMTDKPLMDIAHKIYFVKCGNARIFNPK